MGHIRHFCFFVVAFVFFFVFFVLIYNIKNNILNYLKTNDINISKLLVIGCDGTVVNIVTKGGVIRLIEEDQNKPLHLLNL